MGQTYSNLLYHVVFATKDRRPFLTGDLRPRVCSYIGGILKNENCLLLAADGIEDHLHLLYRGHPAGAISDVMRVAKTNSSRWLRAECGAAEFGWQTGFGVFSVSRSQADSVRSYIGRQREHHSKTSFIDEFRTLCERNGVDFDPRWLT